MQKKHLNFVQLSGFKRNRTHRMNILQKRIYQIDLHNVDWVTPNSGYLPAGNAENPVSAQFPRLNASAIPLELEVWRIAGESLVFVERLGRLGSAVSKGWYNVDALTVGRKITALLFPLDVYNWATTYRGRASPYSSSQKDAHRSAQLYHQTVTKITLTQRQIILAWLQRFESVILGSIDLQALVKRNIMQTLCGAGGCLLMIDRKLAHRWGWGSAVTFKGCSQ